MPVAYHIIVHIILAYYSPLNFKFVTCRVVSDKELGVPVSKVQRGELAVQGPCFVYIQRPNLASANLYQSSTGVKPQIFRPFFTHRRSSDRLP